MSASEAKTFGRKKALKATGILVAILLIILLIMETRGDFANGILFFFQAISNVHLITILIILFGLTYFFAGLASAEIIINKKRNITLIAIKYAVLIILAIIFYAAAIAYYKDNNLYVDNFQLLRVYFVTPLIKPGSIMFIIILPVWLWSTYQMKTVRDIKNE